MFFLRSGRGLALAVAPLDGEAVITAHALHVGVRKISGAVGANLHARREVVHHRTAAVRAGHEVVFEAQHMSHFVAGKQRQPLQHDLLFGGSRIEIVERGKGIQRGFGGVAARGHRGLPIVVHGAHAMRIQLHHGVDDFAGARINVALPD